jgi:hypothetical protein
MRTHTQACRLRSVEKEVDKFLFLDGYDTRPCLLDLARSISRSPSPHLPFPPLVLPRTDDCSAAARDFRGSEASSSEASFRELTVTHGTNAGVRRAVMRSDGLFLAGSYALERSDTGLLL